MSGGLILKEITLREYSQYRKDEVLPLYEAVGWTNYTSRPDTLERAFQGSLKILGAYNGQLLVGLLRAVGDGSSILYVQDLLVHPDFQRLGIGSALLRSVLEEYREVYQKVLLTDATEKNVSFYRAAGLLPITDYGCTGFFQISGT